MKHVFVETNFVIDLLRPFPTAKARRLMDRHGADVTLYLPWCSIAEAKRTLERIVREDLAFIDNAGRFLGRTMQEVPRPAPEYQQHVTELIEKGRRPGASASSTRPNASMISRRR